MINPPGKKRNSGAMVVEGGDKENKNPPI